MKEKRSLLHSVGNVCGGILIGLALWTVAHAAGIFTGIPQPSTTGTPAYPYMTGNELVPADTGLAQGIVPETITLPSSALAGATYGSPRNFLGNGSMLGTQVNGTSTVTCATTSSPTTAALSADRWVCDANVGSGAGNSAVATATPTPPVGYTNEIKLNRVSGSLAQPVCAWQAIPTPQSTQLQSQNVTFSLFAAAMANLSADNGNVANLVIISGTGTDQGFNGAWTASPAITPAWTGITTVVNASINLTTTYARFSTTALIPATATEVGVGICFTPTTTSTGSATDGLAFTGTQLERGTVASLFEVRPRQTEILDNQQFVVSIKEGAATITRAMCMASSTTLAICGLQFPVPMYKVPTMVYTNGFATATTTAGSTLGACTTLRTSTLVAGNAPGTNGVLLDCVAGTVPAAGSADYLADNAGSGVITAWTGF